MASYPERAYVDLLIDEILDAQREATTYGTLVSETVLDADMAWAYKLNSEDELKRLNIHQRKLDKALDELYAALERKAVADG